MSAAAHPDARPTPAPAPTSAYVNLSKQAKYVALGGAGVWYWQIVPHLQDILSNPGWPFNLALLSLAILVATIAIFAHLMLLGASRTPPDYARWHQDPALRSIIPLLTLCIVAGYLSLALTLSPLVAPAPPSASLSSRLLLTAQSLGANLQTATSGTQLLLSDLRRSLPSRDLLSALRLPNAEALARRLGVPAEQGGALLASLETAQGRAQSWKENNVGALGWIGAVAGAGSAYVLVFGVVGLVGLVAMPTRKVRAE